MPAWLTFALLAVAAAAVVVRVTSALRRRGQRGGRLAPVDVAFVALGALGLVLHCTAMFRRGLVAPLPGGSAYVDLVTTPGFGTVALYIVPAALVLIGLRRVGILPWVLLASALVAVGVTMYGGSPLAVHLTAITAAVLALSAVIALRTPVLPAGGPPPRAA